MFSYNIRKQSTLNFVCRADPTADDVLLSDITDSILKDQISERLRLEYLGPAPNNGSLKECHGIIHGDFNRLILPLAVARGMGTPHYYIFFIMDTGSPFTYLSQQVGVPNFKGASPLTQSQAWDKLGMDRSPGYARIGGQRIKVCLSPSDKHFPDVNLLGMDTLGIFDLQLLKTNFGTRDFTLQFRAVEETIHHPPILPKELPLNSDALYIPRSWPSAASSCTDSSIPPKRRPVSPP
jgi:hypothetical protein